MVTNNVLVPHLLHILTNIGVLNIFNCSHFNGCKLYLTVILICIFLLMNSI